MGRVEALPQRGPIRWHRSEIGRMHPHCPTSVLNGGHVGSDCHVINPLYSTGEWSAADVFALPPEGFSRLAQILPRKTVLKPHLARTSGLCAHRWPKTVAPPPPVSRCPSLPSYYFCYLFFIFFAFAFSITLSPRPVSIWTGQCNCLETRFCHLHVASSHFASFSGLTLLYLPARNEIISGVDEKLTSLLHLPVALSDGCHSNHYATEQTRWVKDGFECDSLGSPPGYDRTHRSTRAAERPRFALK